jgi:hypothetical protein
MDKLVEGSVPALSGALDRGVYDGREATRLVNFSRIAEDEGKRVSQSTVARWMRGYDYSVGGERRHALPLWRPDFAGSDAGLQISFRDLIELRFVKAFRGLGLGLPTIRQCFSRAVNLIGDERPFSTRKFRTDGKTIFLEITSDVREGDLIDLKTRQHAFRIMVAPSFHDFEFDGDLVARWFPLGRPSIVLDPHRSFGRPILATGGVPTEVIASAAIVEGSAERAALLYDAPPAAVRDAVSFEQKLAA